MAMTDASAKVDVLALALARAASANGEGKSLRRGAGLSLEEAAQAVGASAHSLRRWEDGTCRPTGVRAQRYGLLLRGLLALKEKSP